MKIVFAVIGGLFAVALLVVGAYELIWHTSDARGRLDAREQTRASGEFRIAAYDHFFELCSAVQAQEDRADNLQAELDTNPSPARVAQIQASLTAVRNQRAELIRTYNADATRDYTVGQFRDNDLPYQLQPNSEGTQCAA